jgi:hypothetical protein
MRKTWQRFKIFFASLNVTTVPTISIVILQIRIQGSRAGIAMPSSGQIAFCSRCFVTMVAGGTGGGTDGKQVNETFVVTVEHKGRRFFAFKDRFVELRMVTLDHQGMQAPTDKVSTVARGPHFPTNVNHSVNMPVLMFLGRKLV